MSYPNFWNLIDQQSLKVFQHKSQYVFSSNEKLETDLYPYIGNGYISTQIKNPWISIDGVYSGEGRNSHRGCVPSTLNWSPFVDCANYSCHLNVGAGIFLEIYENSKFRVSVLYFLCRNVPNVAITHVDVEFLDSSVLEFELYPEYTLDFTSPDFNINFDVNTKAITTMHGTCYTNEDDTIIKNPCQFFLVTDTLPKTRSEAFILTKDKPFKTFVSSYSRLSMEEANTFYEETICRTSDGIEALVLAHSSQWLSLWMNGSVIVEPFESFKDFNDLSHQHQPIAEVKDSSFGDWELISSESSRKESLEEEGCFTDEEVKTKDNLLMSIVHLSQYSILTCLPSRISSGEVLNDEEMHFYSLSPVGLARGVSEDDYMGHVFWDLEFWMLPWINTFHPKQSQLCLDYRYKTMQTAKRIAQSYNESGARFAWESARTGRETCPWEVCGEKEIHVTGCIGWAVYQYLIAHATPNSMINELNLKKSNDEEIVHLSINEKASEDCINWYKAYGSKLLYEIAKFWNSRLVLNNSRNSYDILGVMPPDEYVHECNNSAFTNMISVESLRSPLRILNWLNKLSPVDNSSEPIYDDKQYHEILQWFENSNSLYLPKEEDQNLILEHEDYEMNTTVKQADVVLLEYPLMKNFSKQTRINNMDYYSKVSSHNGPAMTWTIFTICALQLDDPLKAREFFKKNFDFIRGPFYNWTEVNKGIGATNFLTGAGGFLQSIVNGYLGARYRLYEKILLPLMESSGFCVETGDPGAALLLRINWQIPSATGSASGLSINGIKFHGRSILVKVSYFPTLKVCIEILTGPAIRLFSANLPDYDTMLLSDQLDLSKASKSIILTTTSSRTVVNQSFNGILLVFID